MDTDNYSDDHLRHKLFKKWEQLGQEAHDLKEITQIVNVSRDNVIEWLNTANDILESFTRLKGETRSFLWKSMK